MNPEIKPLWTRFRAYQLGNPGASFSYFSDNHFTLIEARLTVKSYASLASELRTCGKTTINTLHITSWDQDHCDCKELREILERFRPSRIEYPGYVHDAENYRNCLSAIQEYQVVRRKAGDEVTAQCIDPTYVKGLESGVGLGYRDIIYHPKQDFPGSNDNSTVKLFRKGMFNVASLGDVEHANIGSLLRSCRILKSEVDVLILAHHGSSNDINSKKFFETIKPTIAICSADYDNQYGHPHEDVRTALYEAGVRVVTTKTGDVLIESMENHRKHFVVTNFQSGSTSVSSQKLYESKKFRLLNMNADTQRNRAHPGFKGLK